VAQVCATDLSQNLGPVSTLMISSCSAALSAFGGEGRGVRCAGTSGTGWRSR